MRRRRCFLVASILLFVVSCARDDTNDPNPTGVDDESGSIVWNPPPLEWDECGTNLSCAVLVVPFDYEDPDLGTFRLPVKRYRSTTQVDRTGSLIVNPGGPGSGGTSLAEYADVTYSAELLARFDIIGWDPRGTGGSTPYVDCVDDLDTYFALDPSPDDVAEEERLVSGAREFAAACQERSGRFLRYLSTNSSARDIESLRRALGEETVAYFGFSYGSELGATWASMFPASVAFAVLDASVNPGLSYTEALIVQAHGFESVLERFFDQCDSTTCSYMTDDESAAESFDRIASLVELNALPTYEGRVPAGPGVMQTAVALAMYGDGWWTLLSAALDAADDGDGAQLLDLYDQYFGEHVDGETIGNDIEAYFAISCLERDSALDTSGVLDLRATLGREAPHLGASWLQEMLICANWPSSPDPRVAIGAVAGERILVVGSTGDAATPLAGGRAMADALGGARFVEVDSNEHTSYGENSCATRIIDDFLLGRPPENRKSNC